MGFKQIIRKIHLWLGLGSGLVVCFLGITGCILAFQKEIESVSKPYQYVQPRSGAYILPSEVQAIAEKQLPGKLLHSVTYGARDKALQVAFYNADPEYYYILFLDPYDGKVLKLLDMDSDFFRIVLMGHYYLWLPPTIGQPIAGSATLIFLVMLISGIVLWWPKKNAVKQRFTLKRNVRWRRKNYDLHAVLGFYMSWIGIFIAVTGLVMGFQWFAKSVYSATSGGKELVPYYEPLSTAPKDSSFKGVDAVWAKMQQEYPATHIIEVHYPASDSAVIVAGANPDATTYWKIDYRYFDRYSLQEIEVNSLFGRYGKASVADKIARMNYDVHIGAIGGLPTKIIVFCASLVISSLPVTGFLIWWGRRKKYRIANKEQGMPIGMER